MRTEKVIISKDLKKNPIYQESLKFRKKCKKTADNIIKRKESYLKNMKFTNVKTLVTYLAEYDINKEIVKEKNIMNQKIRTICESSFKMNFIPAYFTLVLPSRFHPFRTIKRKGEHETKNWDKKVS